MKRQEAPGALEAVRAFINTLNLEAAADALATVDGLRVWLLEHELITPGEPVGEADLRRAVEVRESLRALAGTHSGRTMEPECALVLDRLAADAAVRLRFAPDGTQDLAPHGGTPVQMALGRLLAVVGLARMDGSWQRLKVCPAEACRWAFYDHSKNRSGTWCQMAECGNRAKARNHRARRQDEPTAEPDPGTTGP